MGKKEETLMTARFRGQNTILKEWNNVLTKESKQQKIEICMLRKELEKQKELATMYAELYRGRLNEENFFNSLPWYRKFFFIFNNV